MAFTPTEEQLELFKRLSPEQQKALAERYNLDIDSLGIQSDDSKKDSTSEFILPRNSMAEEGKKEEQNEKDLQTEEKEKELRPFGYDLFAGQPTTFAPMTHAPVPESYILGIGDKIQINFFGKDNQQFELSIDNEGKLSIPGIMPLQVVGMSYAEAKEFLTSKIEEQFIGISASISFSELRSIRVLVVGDVHTSGSYALSSLSTITHALYAAGGIRETGSLREVQLKRNGTTITTLDLYDLLIKGDNTDDTLLKSGDVVFVPSANRLVTVDGEVKRPAVYEITNETYGDVLDYAGGLKQSAFKENVFVYQFNRGVKSVRNVDLSNSGWLTTPVPNFVEMIKVPAASPHIEGAVQVIGAVSHPGFYEWKSELNLSDIFKSGNASFAENADLTYGIVLRSTDDGVEFEQFSPINLIRNKSNDLKLLPEDKIFVFSHDNNHQQLLGLSTHATDDDLRELIRQQTEDSLEQQFFWDLYQGIQQERESFEEATTELPSLFELENELFQELIKKYSIYQRSINSRQYLLWVIYKEVIEKNYSSQDMSLVEVRGNVRYPGLYPYPKNSDLQQLLLAAGGAKEQSSDIIKVSRVEKNAVQQFDVKLKDAKKFTLNKRDAITVFEKPDSANFVSVQLRGEIKFPGFYSVRRGETLSSAIERAGGFTEYAYLDGAVFTRNDLKRKERESLRNIAQDLRKQLAAKKLTQNVTDGTASYEELQNVLRDLTSIDAVGRMVIDLPRIVKNGENDISLERGDVLHVPSITQTVSVIGEVYLPTSHRYIDGVTVEQYVSMSGGVKSIGDKDNIYVVKANGAVIVPEDSFWFSSDKSQLQAGDTIVVPMDAAPVDNLTLWTQATQIMYQISVAIAAVGSL